MDASSTILDEHLSQLHGGSDSSMASVSICNNGVEVVLERNNVATTEGRIHFNVLFMIWNVLV